MTITKNFTQYTRQYNINLREEFLGMITVSATREFGGNELQKPQIDWAGSGRVSVEQTDKFIHALTVAKHLAHCLESFTESPSVKIS
jgi:hypothetical protein